MKLFRKILIANRGEIAVRIINTAKRLGIQTVLVHSEYDKNSFAAQLAGELYLLEGDLLSDTYLNYEKIINAARSTRCEAIHPGYGFLSENAVFAEKCEKNGIVFIGPASDSIQLMGNKLEAKTFAKKSGLPILEGYSGTSAEIMRNLTNPVFPLLVKPAAGGGGKGMKIVNSMHEIKQALESAEREAINYFGNGELYLEKFLAFPRHIEVQVLGDYFGNIVHLFERECTIQRRYQKIIEESPSPTISDKIRKQINASAVELCKKAGYRNAGTVEFLMDEDHSFYFMEMNTRIQVEHPVTEMTTGIDLVEEQILIAAGNPLRYNQKDITLNGHAVECRIYAEDPLNNFLPSPGEMTLYIPPSKKLRIDSAYSKPSEVYSFYDPLISKIISHKQSRNEAILEMTEALEEYAIHGIKTNIAYLISLLKHKDFLQNKISTNFCEINAQDIIDSQLAALNSNDKFIPLSAYLLKSLTLKPKYDGIWQKIGFWKLINIVETWLACHSYTVKIIKLTENLFHFSINGISLNGSFVITGNEVVLTISGIIYKVFVTEIPAGMPQVSFRGNFYPIYRKDFLRRSEFYNELTPGDNLANTDIKSPMPGRVIKLNKKPGERVKKGELLVVIEAMKMENSIISPIDGTITEVPVKQGDMVDSSSPLMFFKELSE